MPFAAFIPCGPGSYEVERVRDTVSALLHYEPRCLQVLIINDGNPGLERGMFPAPCELVDNPRGQRGWGWGGGLLFAELWALEKIRRDNPAAEFVLKLDSDALVIRQFSTQLSSIFADATVGLAGSRIANDPLPAGKTTAALSYFAGKVQKLRAPVSLWRKPRLHLRFSIAGKHRRVAALFGEAEAHGYLPGELIEGGAVAFSMRCIDALDRRGILKAREDFLDAPVSDDIILTMLPYLVGMRAVNSTSFVVEPATLRADPETLQADPEAAIIHSVKSAGDLTEEAIRAFFRRSRAQSSSTIAS